MIPTFVTFRRLPAPVPKRADHDGVPLELEAVLAAEPRLHAVLRLGGHHHAVTGKLGHFLTPAKEHKTYSRT